MRGALLAFLRAESTSTNRSIGFRTQVICRTSVTFGALSGWKVQCSRFSDVIRAS
jgi:hypothetical protein